MYLYCLYSCGIWRVTYSYNIEILFKLQKNFNRIICSNIFASHRTFDAEIRYIGYHKYIIISYDPNLLPYLFNYHYMRSCSIHAHDARQQSLLRPPQYKLKKSKIHKGYDTECIVCMFLMYVTINNFTKNVIGVWHELIVSLVFKLALLVSLLQQYVCYGSCEETANNAENWYYQNMIMQKWYYNMGYIIWPWGGNSCY